MMSCICHGNLATSSDWTKYFFLRNICCSCVVSTLKETPHVFYCQFLFYGTLAKPYLKNTAYHKNSFKIVNRLFSCNMHKTVLFFFLLNKSQTTS